MNPAAIRLMADKGLSAYDIAEILEAMQTKSSGAERQARYRARKAAESNDSDVTRDVTSDVTDSPLSLPPKEIKSNPPTHTPVKNNPARGKHRLPADWQPKPLTGDTAEAVKVWPSGAIERELSKFRDWAAQASGTNAKKLDWDAAYRNWLRSADEKGIYRKNGGNNRNGNVTESAVAGAKARLASIRSESPSGNRGSDVQRIGPVSDPVRSLGYVTR